MVTTKGEDIASIIAAHEYAYTLRKLYNDSGGHSGAFIVVINASWGIEGMQYTDALPWCSVYDLLGSVGILTVAAAPNSYVDVDVVGDMPTTCPSDFLITVAATGQSSAGNLRSGYGARSVDVAAPGSEILTTTNSGEYTTFSGTSAATPLVTGLISYLYTLPTCPESNEESAEESALRIKQAVMAGALQRPNLHGKVTTSEIVNYQKAIDILKEGCGAPASLTPTFSTQFSPNPTSDIATITLFLDEAGIAHLTLLSLSGQLRQTEHTAVLGPGIHYLSYSVSSLPPAVYLLRVTFQQRSVIHRIVVQ